MMSVTDAVNARRSTRAFLNKPVDPDLLRRILATASRSPSGGNLQPWHAYVMTGADLAALKEKVRDSRKGGTSAGKASPSTWKSGLPGSQMTRSGSQRRPMKPAVWPAGFTLSLRRITSGSQTDVYDGSLVLGLSILTMLPM